jgi:hypothetical protein
MHGVIIGRCHQGRLNGQGEAAAQSRIGPKVKSKSDDRVRPIDLRRGGSPKLSRIYRFDRGQRTETISVGVNQVRCEIFRAAC